MPSEINAEEATMRRARTVSTIVVAGLAATAVALPAGASEPAATAAKGPHFEGTVVSVNRAARTFRLRDAERGTVRIKVTSSTSYQRIAGFGALRAGMANIEAKVRRTDGRWVAWKIERG
jgi:hypothetical protein